MLPSRARPPFLFLVLAVATQAASAGSARADAASPLQPTTRDGVSFGGATFQPPPGVPEPADPPAAHAAQPQGAASTEAAPQAETAAAQPPKDAPAAAPAAAGAAAANAEQPAPAKPKEDTWLDVGHAFIEQRIFAPVLRLDRFFSDERELEPERARSFLRWRSEIAFDDRSAEPRFTTGVRANLRLPGLEKRLERIRVVIEGQTRDTIAALFPTEPGATTPPPEEPIGTANAELRFRFWETLASHADVGAGLLFELPPGAFARTRLRFVVPIKQVVLTRYLASAFWRTDTHLGTSLSGEMERPLRPTVVARIGGAGSLTQRSHGVEWSAEAVTVAALQSRVGAQVGLQVNGATRAIPSLDRWRLYTRLRRDFYRRWLFFEVEPAVWWPWIPGEGRPTVWGVALRLEVQFQGTERPVTPPSADLRGPAGPAGSAPSGAPRSLALPRGPEAR